MPINNIWTIQGATGEPTTFAVRNLMSVNSQRLSQAVDTVTFTQAASYDADPEFADGETVTIYRDGAQWFKGRCTAIKRQGSAQSERINYTISGPWWQLQNIIFEQSFNRWLLTAIDPLTYTETEVTLARIILGTDIDGARITSGEAITEAVNYALTALGSAALFQLGDVDPSAELPYEELNSLSCAEVINRVLRWHPDVVAYFDYATTPPTLHFKKRSALSSQTFAIDDVIIAENSINPRHDLQKNGVIIKYERVDSYNDEKIKRVITDEAGATSDPFKTLKLYFNLEGYSVTYLTQAVKVETIQPNSATWWRKNDPELALATAITVSNGVRSPALNDEGEAGESYTAQLIEGSIANWMEKETWQQIVTAEVSYTLNGENFSNVKKTLGVVGTNATTKNYQIADSESVAETKPEGLAADILSSINTLHYDGIVELTQGDVSADNHLAKKINVSGGRVEWATMNAQVYEVNYSLDKGSTVIAFGPARHLGATDLFQLARNVRTRQPATGQTRATGEDRQHSLPTKGPNTTTGGGGSVSSTPQLNAYKTGDDTIRVRPGTVDGVVVTALAGGALDSADVSVAVGYKLWLKVTLVAPNGAISTAVMQNTDPGPMTNTMGHRLAVEIISDGSGGWRIQNYLSGSQDHDSCGSDHSFILS